MSILREPFLVASSLALAVAAGCEVRVETPLDDDFSDDDGSSEAPPLTPSEQGHGRGEDLTPPPLDYDPDPETTGDVEPLHPDLPPHLYPGLIVIDAELIGGPLASSANADAPFSFRAQMEWLAGERDSIDFTHAWLEQWESVTAVGAAQAPVVPRPAARHLLLDPWLGAAAGSSEAAPSTGGSAGAYGTPTPTSTPSWSHAPFQLIAIVNRVDLASDPCAAGGELRYVYTAIDPDTGAALDMTAILEVPYPRTRSAAEWARAWSDLARLPPGSRYAAELESLVLDVRAEADPLRARLLTSEVALASVDSPGWEMREFHLQIEAAQLGLVQTPLDRTPRADIDAARLAEHVLTHADEIRGPGVALPDDMQAGAAPLSTADFSWRVLGVSESLRRSFSLQTCNGCHGGDAEALPFQHITPVDLPDISARVSRTLYAPDQPSDELRRRALVLDALAQSVCEPEPDASAYP